MRPALDPAEGPKLATREGGSEWELIKILLEGDGYSNKTNTASQITSPTQLPKLAKTTQPLECYWS
jgi:hypothetical protein